MTPRTPRSATPSHLKKRASAWAARVADAVYGAATCGAYGRLQQEAAWLQNASVAAEATLLRLQLEAATTEQAAVEATRAHELRLLELRDQPEARRVLHEERMAAEQTRRMRIEAEERAAAREREARAERDKVAMQLWSEAQREVYDRVVEGHTRLYERVVAEAASGCMEEPRGNLWSGRVAWAPVLLFSLFSRYMEVEGGQVWSGLTDAWFGKRLIPIAQALKLPKTRRRAAEELQRIVDFRMRLQGLMAPGEQLRQVAPGSALLALTDGGDSSSAVSSPSPPLPSPRQTAAAALRLAHAGGGEAPAVVDACARSKAARTVESVRLADVGFDVPRGGGETPRDLATPRHLATPDAADRLPAGEGESVEDELEVEANEALQSLLAETCPSPLQGARHSMSDGGRFGEPQGFVVC